MNTLTRFAANVRLLLTPERLGKLLKTRVVRLALLVLVCSIPQTIQADWNIGTLVTSTADWLGLSLPLNLVETIKLKAQSGIISALTALIIWFRARTAIFVLPDKSRLEKPLA